MSVPCCCAFKLLSWTGFLAVKRKSKFKPGLITCRRDLLKNKKCFDAITPRDLSAGDSHFTDVFSPERHRRFCFFPSNKSHGFNCGNIMPSPCTVMRSNREVYITNELFSPCFLVFVLPRKALGMVILSHMRSLTSRPDSGDAMALATDAMSECSDKLKSSKPGERER